MKKTVIILRAVPGSGKSTFADYLKYIYKGITNPIICCADDYFMVDGEYKFDFAKLGAAHTMCFNKFVNAIESEFCQLIIVANTSTRESDVNRYRNVAIANDCMVFVITLENWHNGMDVHNVPEEAKENMKKQLLASIKL